MYTIYGLNLKALDKNSFDLHIVKQCFLEPVNGAAPKVPPTAKITVFTMPSKTTITMLCQAQANPLPIFRYVCFQNCNWQSIGFRQLYITFHYLYKISKYLFKNKK